MAEMVNMNATLAGITSDGIELYNGEAVNMNVTLAGISANILLDTYDHMDDILVAFDLKADATEDISIKLEMWREFMYGAHTTFEILKWDTYRYQNMPVLFHILSGIQFDDMPVMFSVIKQPQTFEAYILQKTYSVTTELYIKYCDLEIQDWNVSPNQTWYVMVDGLSVYLYATQADLEADINVVASGTADPDTLKTVLFYASTLEAMNYYYQDWESHLTLSAYVTTGKHYFKLKPMTDLSEIRHPIYNNASIVEMRGEAELNLHTYAVLKRELTLGTHIPEMEVGEIVYHSSTRRGLSRTSQILAQTISGASEGDGSCYLLNTITVANYMELKR